MMCPLMLTKRNHRLHCEIWAMTRLQTDNGSFSERVQSLRKEIEANHRKLREIDYLKRADPRVWQKTVDFIERLGK